MLGESEQLLGLRGIRVHLCERLWRIPGGEPVDRVASVRDARAQQLDVSSYTGDDLGRPPRPSDLVGEGRGVLVEHVLRPVAQLHDTRVAGPKLFAGVGDVIVIELVQPERLAQVRAHRDERLAQRLGRIGAQLRLGEDELIGCHADALVGSDEGRISPLRQVGVLSFELLLIPFALAPEPGHAFDPRGGAGSGLWGSVFGR